jgi:hypothetical protein
MKNLKLNFEGSIRNSILKCVHYIIWIIAKFG